MSETKLHSVRMPVELIAVVKEKARENGRSFNAEIVHRMGDYDALSENLEKSYKVGVNRALTIAGLAKVMWIKGVITKEEEENYCREYTECMLGNEGS